MAEIHPFKAVMYSTEKIGDITQVLTPPYDVITPAMQEGFYQSHPNNFVRIDFGTEHPGDNDVENRYTRAASFLNQWLEEGVLIEDGSPAIYVYDQTYSIEGREFTRRAFVSIVPARPYESKSVLPHELTHAGPKLDRLNLTKATDSAFSQIFVLYDDEECQINQMLESRREDQALLEFEEPHGGTSRIFRVTDIDAIRSVQDYLHDKPLYIADGHHRYETSLNFSQFSLKNNPGLHGAKYVAMSCVSMNDPGLVILPTHRSVKLPEGQSLDEFMNKLQSRFSCRASGDVEEVLQSIGNQGGKTFIGMYVPKTGFSVLEIDFEKDGANDKDHSKDWNELDVSVLHCRILKDCMLVPEEDLFSKGPIFYSHSHSECITKVESGEYDVCFFIMNATLADLKTIVRSEEKMPPKSTFFYPKLMSGLFTYRMKSFEMT
ncbi:MAG: DUF1015 domain-containing protein [Planctomycetota bacterium]|jgi:uncharacterized protein (DUF1015 family)|nr:DUF1015 domain-containing protein [Planctomycetota bacterium]